LSASEEVSTQAPQHVPGPPSVSRQAPPVAQVGGVPPSLPASAATDVTVIIAVAVWSFQAARICTALGHPASAPGPQTKLAAASPVASSVSES
jgi:hypothetical protein